MTLPLKFELEFKIGVQGFSEGGAYTMFWVAPPSLFLLETHLLIAIAACEQLSPPIRIALPTGLNC